VDRIRSQRGFRRRTHRQFKELKTQAFANVFLPKSAGVHWHVESWLFDVRDVELANVDEVASNRGCRCHDWAHQVRAAVAALAALKIAV
jgi:hypothetical protein